MKDGRVNKLPLDRYDLTRTNNSLLNAESWQAISRKVFSYSNLGLGFYPDSVKTYLVGVDLDHVWDGAEMRADAKKILKKLDSYTEFSPSRNGLHIWVRSQFAPENHNGKACEIISRGNRYLTVTGWVYADLKPIQHRSDELQEIIEEFFPEPKQQEKTQRKGTREEALSRVFLSDADYQTLRKLWSKQDRRELWHGDISLYADANHPNGDRSRADLALCRMLYLCSDCDPDAVDRLFRQSGLMRDKWDQVHHSNGMTYGQMTIERAIRGL